MNMTKTGRFTYKCTSEDGAIALSCGGMQSPSFRRHSRTNPNASFLVSVNEQNIYTYIHEDRYFTVHKVLETIQQVHYWLIPTSYYIYKELVNVKFHSNSNVALLLLLIVNIIV